MNPLKILTNNAEKTKWNNQKFPADPVFMENYTILANSEKWPLMTASQFQFIK